jgi:uncharacterized protein (UPF0261 family)
MATVVLIGTLDTKADEYAYVRDRIREEGCDVVMINAGPLADPGYDVDYSRHDVARAAGADLDAMLTADDRGAAVATMSRGVTAITADLHAEGRLDGVFAMGGSGGTSLASAAMRRLPVGVPKMVVSTLGAGDVSAFVGTSDLAMMHSVVDIAGINQVSAQILSNAAAAVAGMARSTARRRPPEGGRRLVGATMYGATTPCVEQARAWLEGRGYEVLVFHATGIGGGAMEMLVESGHITAVLDITTAEVLARMVGGSFGGGPDRLEVAGRAGIPQVVSVGAADMIAFTPPESLPESWRSRRLYAHNPSVTLVRTSTDESARLGALLARKLVASRGPVALYLPLRGVSAYDVPGGVFHDPEADAALFEAIRTGVDSSVELIEVDAHVNDAEFAAAMAQRLDAMVAGAVRR